MTKVKYSMLFVIGGILLVVNNSCKKNTTTQQPQNNAVINQANNTPVNVSVLLSNYGSMQYNGGYIYIDNVGVKGILLYRVSETQYNAFERDCTYDGTTITRAKVWVENTFNSKDSVCGSTFNISDGTVIHGPATYSLKQYNTSYDASSNTVRITN